MAQISLMEGERGAVPFIVNRSKPFVTEQRNGVSFSRIPGRFSICDSVNGNNRRYPKKVWLTFLAIAANPKFNEPHAANPTLGAITLIQWAWFLTEVFENNIDDMKVLPEHLRGRQH